MIRRKTGFTLIELLVVIAILGFVLAVASDMFVGMLRGYKQQGKIAETNIEGIIGLELLRRDIESAGYGLPWVVPITYQEAVSTPASKYNDATSNPPRPILSGPDGFADPGSGVAHSDYLVIKATNITRNPSSQLWTYMTMTTGGLPAPIIWTPASENPPNSDYAIVLNPGTGNLDTRKLVPISGTNVGGILGTLSSNMSMDGLPTEGVIGFVYDIGPDQPKMPFNRADYYIVGPGQTTDKIPSRCAPNTGVLEKRVLNQSNGLNNSVILPLLDCVADMRVIFRLDTDGDGAIDDTSDDISILTAQQIRQQVKEVRVYILAHEGQKDNSFTYGNPSPAPCTSSTQIYVGDTKIGHGRCFDIGTNVNYRWKLYTVAVQPKNMQQPLGSL
jgi:prepilin-type N-terminal cleavage/methylation domain-containing protein